MADVSIGYNGANIAELDVPGTKTLKTGGTYCAGDIQVTYAPSCRTYELTLAKASGWVLLTTLDADVLEHINDASLVVALTNMSGYAYEYYSANMMIASNTQQYVQGSYPVYGISMLQGGETSCNPRQVYYPPNKTNTSASLGGGGALRVTGGKYYLIPADGYVRAGTYRLTFTW